jgi:hypothetical protein
MALETSVLLLERSGDGLDDALEFLDMLLEDGLAI